MAGGGNHLRGCLTLLWAPREFYLALGVGLWLGGYFMADGWEQLRAFKWLLPLFLLNGDLLVKSFRETPWLWAATALLAYQAVSRLWSTGSEPISNGADLAMVFLLLLALVTIGRREELAIWIVGGLALLCAAVTLYSLLAFYGDAGRVFGYHRLRNMLIYDDGLNAVLTGMLCAFGAVGAAWFTRGEDWPVFRYLWLALLALLVLGLMASESRGPMLAGGTGIIVLMIFLRRAMAPALVTIALSVATFLAIALISRFEGTHLERGTTGRLEIYAWFLHRVTLLEGFFGMGMSADLTIPETELGWFVHHPHSSYLTQFLLTGAIGLALVLFVLGWAGCRGLTESRRGNPLWLALLASGSVALLFDCGQIFSLYSVPRIEFLLVVVPAALLMGRAGAEG